MKNKKDRNMLYVIGIFCILAGVFFGCNGAGNGEGGEEVTSINNVLGSFPPFTPEPGDLSALGVFDIIPPFLATNVPPTTGIVIFFTDEVDPSSVSSDSVIIEDDGSPVSGQFGGVLDADGNTVLFFMPNSAFFENSTITIDLPSTGPDVLLDDGGNPLSFDDSSSFDTGSSLGMVPSANLGFEQGLTGWFILGDGAVLTGTQGEVGPTEGSNMAGIDTGEMHVSSNFSINSIASFLFSGGITVPQGATKMFFDFDFISEEFDEWVEEGFDDFFVFAAVGPSGVFASLLASVDLVGEANSIPLSSLGPSIQLLVDDTSPGTSDHTGWITVEVPSISSLGSPIYLGFAVSDVGDASWYTLAVIDNIRFE
jgi:hypothetical protein